MARKNLGLPGLDFYFFSDDVFPPNSTIPVNRRNPKKAKKAKATRKRRTARKNPSVHQRNAAAAMALKNAEGITLKEAWAIVKGNPHTSWPRYDRYQMVEGAYGPTIESPPVNRRNPKKAKKRGARKNPDAAKAMRMMHNEGITLKQAWRRIKKNRR